MKFISSIDLFAGVGGMRIALNKAIKKLGLIDNCKLYSEINLYCQQTYEANFPNTHLLKDIKTVKKIEIHKKIPDHDILLAGFPCQPFSVAGYQKGFEDDRGNIFYKIMNLVDSMKQKPKVLFLENVKNLYTHDKKRTYARIYSELEARGYSVFTKILNTASYTKIPQNRERTFIICFRNEAGWEFDPKKGPKSKKFSKLFPPKPVGNPESIHKYLEKTELTNIGY